MVSCTENGLYTSLCNTYCSRIPVFQFSRNFIIVKIVRHGLRSYGEDFGFLSWLNFGLLSWLNFGLLSWFDFGLLSWFDFGLLSWSDFGLLSWSDFGLRSWSAI